MVELKITFDPSTGQVQVSGPIQDKILCCGLLEMAKNTVLAQKQESKILVPVLRGIPKNGESA